MEEGRTPIIVSVKQTDPFRKQESRFGDKSCMVESSRDCSIMGAVYEITCNQCNEPVNLDVEVDQRSRDPGNQNRHNYIGMTRLSVHCQMNGHLEGQKSKSTTNPLYRHDLETHDGVPQTYTTRILNVE